MAVTDIRWSDNIYSIREVINTYNLPLLVKVTQGHFSGPDEDSLSQGQIVRLAGWQRMKRVKARDVRGRIITLPLTFPIPFGIIPYNMSTIRGRLNKFRQLKLQDLVRRYQLPQKVKISSKHFSKRELIIPGVDLISDAFDLVELYEEVVLQGNAINFGNLDETPLNIPLRNSEMQVTIGLGLTKGSQTEWDALHAGLTEKFHRKVKLPKIVDGKGVLIVHQVPANDQRQQSSPHETDEFYGTSVPRKEPRYKKRLETPSIGSTLPNRYRTNEQKTRRLIKVDDDNLSLDGSDSSGIASPDGARSPVFPQDLSPTSDNFTLRSANNRGYYNPSSPTRRSSGVYSAGRSSDDISNLSDREQYPDYPRTTHNTMRSYDLMNEGHDDGGMDLHPGREEYPGYPKTTQNPMMEKPMFEEGSTDSGNATWYNSGESTMGDTGDHSTAGLFGQKNTERPQMIQEYLHSVGRDTIVRNKHVASDNENLYLKPKMNTNSSRGGNIRYKSRSVQEFNVADTPRNDAYKARSMYDLDDDEASTLSRPRDLFGTVAKISRFRPSLWSPGWGNQG